MWRIVLVDDDLVVRRGIMRSINWEKHGLSVVGEASNGKSGFEIIRQFRPDIVITDIKMPVFDGLWLCERVTEHFPGTGLIIISGYEDFDYARRAVHLGVKEYLVKPVMADDLVEVVLALADQLDRRRHASIASLPVKADRPGRLSELRAGETSALVRRAIQYVEHNYMKPIELRMVAAELYISESHFSKVFKAETGKNFTDYLNRVRIDHACALLPQLDLKIADVAEMVGYQSYKYFHRNFSKYMDCSPHQYRNRIAPEVSHE